MLADDSWSVLDELVALVVEQEEKRNHDETEVDHDFASKIIKNLLIWHNEV